MELQVSLLAFTIKKICSPCFFDSWKRVTMSEDKSIT